MTDAPVRSWLYVPGHRPDLAAKALAGEADAVVVDLEDGVPADAKDQARQEVARLLADPTPAKPVWLRLAGPSEDDWAADVASAGPALGGVRLPKAEQPQQVAELEAALSAAGLHLPVHCLLETALGVENAFALASCPSVTGIGLGEADLAADLGADADQALAYARSRCVNAARAAGAMPVQSVYIELGDEAGLAATTRAGSALGFMGRSAVHPRQIPIIHAALMPTADALERARAVVAAMEAAAGPTVLPDGRFVDAAVEKGARRILALAGEPAS